VLMLGCGSERQLISMKHISIVAVDELASKSHRK